MAHHNAIDGPGRRSADGRWLSVWRPDARYSSSTGGKWMLFPSAPALASAWQTISTATLDGHLGPLAKVGTTGNLICVYTADHTDTSDVTRVLNTLRDLGFDGRLAYKEDLATTLGMRESLYIAQPDARTFRQRRPPAKARIWDDDSPQNTSRP